MGEPLDEIFEKIFVSEQEAQSQKTSMREVKTKITQAEACAKELDEEISSLKGQMLIQVQKLSEKELLGTSLKIKEEILLRRKKKLQAEKEDAGKILTDVREQLRSLTQNFCSDVFQFTSKFGFQKETENSTHKKNAKQGLKLPVHLRIEYPPKVWGQRSKTETQEEAHSVDDEEIWESNSSSDIAIDGEELQRIKEEFENCDEECFLGSCISPELKPDQNME